MYLFAKYNVPTWRVIFQASWSDYSVIDSRISDIFLRLKFRYEGESKDVQQNVDRIEDRSLGKRLKV